MLQETSVIFEAHFAALSDWNVEKYVEDMYYIHINTKKKYQSTSFPGGSKTVRS